MFRTRASGREQVVALACVSCRSKAGSALWRPGSRGFGWTSCQRTPQRKTLRTARTFRPVRYALPCVGAVSGAEQEFSVTITLQGARDPVRLELTVTDAKDATRTSEKLPLSKAKAKPFARDDPTLAGTVVELKLSLPVDFTPGVVILNKTPEPDGADEAPPFVALVAVAPAGGGPALLYSAYTYIDLGQGDRWLFPSSAAYPGFEGATPGGLAHFRGLELAQLRGTAENLTEPRAGVERIYQYDVYNDLGDPKEEQTSRPTLGGKEQKYPRRLRTGRPLIAGGFETPTKADELPWLPIDEHFNATKNHAFTGGTKNAFGRLGSSLVGTPRGLSFAFFMQPFIKKMYDKKQQNIFTNLSVVDALYEGLEGSKGDDGNVFKGLLPVAQLGAADVVDTLHGVWSKLDDGIKRSLGSLAAKKDIDDAVAAVDKRRAARDSDADKAGDETPGEKVSDVVGLVNGLLDKWPVPRVREGRALEWRSDEAFGRSALAGQNPCSIRAVTEADLQTTAIQDSHVAGLMGEFATREEARTAGRLWVLDFVPGYDKYVTPVAKLKDSKRVLYAGRCLFYTRSDDVTVPIAIELKADGDKEARVVTPRDPAEVWLLAKTVVSSLDSGVHQLISHWLRTHACVEPYIIAMRRELSVMNPVYKLLKPHFRYTLRINCNARKALIAAGGIVESGFTPGRYSMQLSSDVYASWRFDEQALPSDLLKRGVAEKAGDGKLRLKLPNYRYAEDGLMLYEAIETYVGDYLKLYYKDDSASEKVTDDAEVVAWWRSVREEGHPDTAEGWPELSGVDSLRDILASIIWIASCHHAAVNFGQYDNSGYFPYKPSKIIAKMPAPNSKEEKVLQNRFDSVLLNTVTDPIAALSIMVTVKILSAHATDEEYLDRAEHSYIKEPAGVEVHRAFVAALKRVEEAIAERNETRAALDRGLPYTLLIPSNDEPETLPSARPSGRGIPYSISI